MIETWERHRKLRIVDLVSHGISDKKVYIATTEKETKWKDTDVE